MTVIERERVVTKRERRARVLEAAALEIEVRGWAQGIYQDTSGGVCLRGACGIAQGLGAEYELTEDAWGRDPSWKHPYFPFGVFNDEPGRTPEEVTFLLRWRAEEIRSGR